MARLPAIKQSQMDDRQKQVYDVIATGPRGNVRGPLAIWLHRVDLADKAQALGQYCRYQFFVGATFIRTSNLDYGPYLGCNVRMAGTFVSCVGCRS